MPSVKIPRKSTATDMTPFVDVAFLILSFFMLATKFKPPEPAQITTPRSVSSDMLKESNSVVIDFDSSGRIFFTMNVKKADDEGVKRLFIENLNKQRNLGLGEAEMKSFQRNTTVGVPFNELKATLAKPQEQRAQIHQKGIPADSANNELADWIGVAKSTFYNYNKNMEVFYMIKGDNKAKFPLFNGIIEAMRKNDQFSFKLVTDPEEAPMGTALYTERQKGKGK